MENIQPLSELLAAEAMEAITSLSVETPAQWRSQKRGIPYWNVERAVRDDPADVQTYRSTSRAAVEKLERFHGEQIFQVHENRAGSPQGLLQQAAVHGGKTLLI